MTGPIRTQPQSIGPRDTQRAERQVQRQQTPPGKRGTAPSSSWGPPRQTEMGLLALPPTPSDCRTSQINWEVPGAWADRALSPDGDNGGRRSSVGVPATTPGQREPWPDASLGYPPPISLPLLLASGLVDSGSLVTCPSRICVHSGCL